MKPGVCPVDREGFLFLSCRQGAVYIEGVFHEVQNTGRNLERLLAKTVVGLCTRIIAKMTSHLLRHLLLIDFGLHVQTFQVTD